MRAALVLSIVSATVLIAASCGGDSAVPGPSPAPPPGGSAVTIEIAGELGARSFEPNPAAPGTTRMVAWRNSHNVVHRIVANDGSFDTGDIGPGGSSAAITIPEAGTNYHCSRHHGMIGAINGTGGAPPPCTGVYCGGN
jgi:plastocyanin